MNDLIDQHHNLIIYLLEELEKVKNERDEYKFKIANIYHILNNDIVKQKEGIIKQNESE